MALRPVSTGLLFLTAAVLGSGPAEAGEASKKEVSLNDLSIEVAALQTLHAFKFTPAQLERLQKLARETSAKPRERKPARASSDFRTAVTALREALLDDLDDDQIDSLEEQLDALRESEKPELDDDYDVTDAARRRAPELFRRLSAPQLASYIAANADDIQDPLDIMTESFAKARRLKAKEWKEFREEVGDEVGRLVVGLNEDRADKVSSRVVALLIRVRGLKEEEFKNQRPELEKEARRIVADVSALDVLRHTAEYALAELLSNPRLRHVLKARLSVK